MKVVHIIKRIETIDEDIKDLRKLEKSISSNKSFSTPIYLSIEKQINILLDTRNKFLGLAIANPPADLAMEIEGPDDAVKSDPKTLKSKPKSKKPVKQLKKSLEKDEAHIVTQDLIDQRFQKLKEEKEKEDRKTATILKNKDDDSDDDMPDDNSIKLLDIALESGTLNSQDKDKRKVRFFKDNFPGGGDY